ncbi:uncharacterized protein LOC113332867 [Papaver somniferum]|uniref:uncharacterized protein LOC113332867 n=1 Tax=Papaver somniferum TaxID=3469 RepID=UPI000E6F67D5|nr:uncharacterized protein LOC113332867 [Papaver somniferum]
MDPLVVDLSKIPVTQSAINLINDNDKDRYESWRFSLIGRLDLLRIKFLDASNILRKQWKLTAPCQLIPLGKGFFTIKLSNEEDKNHIKSGTWEAMDQILKVRNWIPNFRSENQRTSKAMIWVQFPSLSLEYWDEKTLFTISRAIGNPIKVDSATLQYQNGYYAKCKIVGHYQSECRLKKSVEEGFSVEQSVKLSSPINGSPKKPDISIPAPAIQTHTSANKSTSTSQIPSSSDKTNPAAQVSNATDKPLPINNPTEDKYSPKVPEISFVEPQILIDPNKVISETLSTSGISLISNQYEVLQDNEFDSTSSEDGEIKEVSPSNLLDYSKVVQPVNIIKPPDPIQTSNSVSSSVTKNITKKSLQ